MTRNELLLRMKMDMLSHIDYQKEEYASLTGEDERVLADVLDRFEEDRKTVSECTGFKPIFDVMHGWSAPMAIMFVITSAISDPENIKNEDKRITDKWD